MTQARPILFSGPMVRALLAGNKTQTRRVIKPVQPRADGMWPAGRNPVPDCPYGKPGDLLWVRESWAKAKIAQAGQEWVVYRDGDSRTDFGGPWKPSIHMPREANRITLEITAVRVERLHDITEADAIAEGATRLAVDADYGTFHRSDTGTYKTGFLGLWRHINGAESLEANPFVWVVEFLVHPRNVDEVMRERGVAA